MLPQQCRAAVAWAEWAGWTTRGAVGRKRALRFGERLQIAKEARLALLENAASSPSSNKRRKRPETWAAPEPGSLRPGTDDRLGRERRRQNRAVAAVRRRKENARRHAVRIHSAWYRHAAPVEEVAKHGVAQRLGVVAEEDSSLASSGAMGICWPGGTMQPDDGSA